MIMRFLDRIIAWPLWKLAHFVEWIVRRLRRPTNPGWIPIGWATLHSGDGTEMHSTPIESDGSTIRSVRPMTRGGFVAAAYCRWFVPDGRIIKIEVSPKPAPEAADMTH